MDNTLLDPEDYTVLEPEDLPNIQGDIFLNGLPKKREVFWFFQIIDAEGFRQKLHDLIPLISTTTFVQEERQKILQSRRAAGGVQKPIRDEDLVPTWGVNIAFSQTGLGKLAAAGGPTGDLGDNAFRRGMLKDAPTLGDQVKGRWLDEFKDGVDGVVLVTGSKDDILAEKLGEVENILARTTKNTISLKGKTRKDDQSAHEHFGFLDSISQPSVERIDPPPAIGEPTQVKAGVFVLGRVGDSIPRPAWAQDGSFLCFRYLPQLVPEFQGFLEEVAQTQPTPIGAPPEFSASDLVGARLVGRWKSGAPTELHPLVDPKTTTHVDDRNNAFMFTKNDDNIDDQISQERCPFAAHIRKTNPRADLRPDDLDPHRIIRRGIQFGEEVSDEEKSSGKSNHNNERGLLFACYQSSIDQGFSFLMKFWVNLEDFPPKGPIISGFDPIIGQTIVPSNDPEGTEGPRGMFGLDPNDTAAKQALTREWVIPKGGEYFFVPSMHALNIFAL